MDLLSELGQRYGTDKVWHGFCAFYHRHLQDQRESVRHVLEIGVLRGSSLLMWRDYFPNATIHGLDIGDRSIVGQERVHVHQGDQAQRDDLQRVLASIAAELDVIIDDGGHTMQQQQVSLAALFPALRPGGVYLLEDLHTSFTREIMVVRDGQCVSSYHTGAGETQCTSYDLVYRLLAGQLPTSDFMSLEELTSVAHQIESGEIFDRDGDRQHITAALRKRAT